MNHKPEAQFDVTAIGRVASEARMSLTEILSVAGELGISPAGRINGVAYFNSVDVERLMSHIRMQPPASIHSQAFY